MTTDFKLMNALKTLLVAMAIFTVSCAKKMESANQASGYTPIPTDGSSVYVPPVTAPGYDPGTQYGATALMNIPNLNVMRDYTGRPMNNPQNIKMNLNLKKYGSSYGGTVLISYTDNGFEHKGFFTSGHTANETKYNVWFTKSGKKVWHGFFEDFMGAVVVVIDGVEDLGDGVGPESKATGSVWFKNFGYTYAPRPPAFCWFVSLGPYDCRAWKQDRVVETTRAVEPDNGYTKLGTFSDLDLKSAFNGEI